MVKRSYDTNHADIVKVYRDAGCAVLDLTAVPQFSKEAEGCPDLLVGIAGENELVEVKTKDGDLRKSQVTWHTDWRGKTPVVVRTRDEALEHIGRVRARFRSTASMRQAALNRYS